MIPPGVPLPRSLHWLGDRPSASASQHATDKTGCVMYFTNETDCQKFMRWLTGRSGDPTITTANLENDMSKAKHTPGPWSYNESVEMILGPDGLAIGHMEPASGPLAAAAPDMLAALQLVQAMVFLKHGDESKVVAAAIAKATGR